jgi:hypothetical protein
VNLTDTDSRLMRKSKRRLPVNGARLIQTRSDAPAHT